jgi:hypothetical protein
LVVPEEKLTSLRVKINDNYLFYNPDNILFILEKKHRIKTVCIFLTKNDKWWIIEFYFDGQ